MVSISHIEETLETLSRLQVGQKLSMRMGSTLKIDKRPNRVYRLFTADSKIIIFHFLDYIIDMAMLLGIRMNYKIINALENYKITYNYRIDVCTNFGKLQTKIRDYLNDSKNNSVGSMLESK